MAKATEVFVPSSTPTVTYVDRSQLGIEKRLRTGCEIPNMVVSVSGPSKSGKTVLIKKVVSEDNLITVSGSAIRNPDDLWDGVLAWMGTPLVETVTTTSEHQSGVSGKAAGELGLPLLAKGAVEGAVDYSTTRGTQASQTARTGGLAQVVREIANSDFVVFIDDFHYIPREIQAEVGRHIKSAAEFGVKVITASVPHRSDDVVRSNPELRGRVVAVDLEYWSESDLRQIAYKGFKELNVDLAPSIEAKLASEAFGSPQLMQTICLSLCYEADAKETKSSHERLDVNSDLLQGVLEQASFYADYSTLIDTLHSGPKQRGTERKIFDLNDGSKGDVYRCVLLALKQDPPKLSIRYDEMLDRVRSVCISQVPVGSSVSEALSQMDKLAQQISPTSRVLEWDADVLDIVEPYFLFFLRFSSRLQTLAS